MLIPICLIAIVPVLIIALLLRVSRSPRFQWLEKWFVRFDQSQKADRRKGANGLVGLSVLIVTVILLLSFGFTKRESWWTEGEIVVMADSTTWADTRDILKSRFEKIIRTPQKEILFSLRHGSPEEWMHYASYKQLFVLGTLESDGKLINKLRLKEDAVRKQILKQGYLFRQDENLFSKNQFILTCIGQDRQSLEEFVHTNIEIIFKTLEKDRTIRLQDELVSLRHEKILKDSLLQTAGWTFGHFHDLNLDCIDPERGFVSLASFVPGRWIFVRWIDSEGKPPIDPEWIIAERNRLGSEYYDSVYVEDKYRVFHEGEIQNHPAAVLSGLWGDDQPVWGGPFKSYTFYDSASKRIYMIDISVYGAGEDKLPDLRRLDAVAHSFTTAVF